MRELKGKYRDAAYLFGFVDEEEVDVRDLAPACIHAVDHVCTIVVVKGDDGELNYFRGAGFDTYSDKLVDMVIDIENRVDRA